MKKTEAKSSMRRRIDQMWMKRVLELALRSRKHSRTQPRIGVIISKGGVLISEAYRRHEKENSPVYEALHKASGRTSGSTLYTNIEPLDENQLDPFQTAAAILEAGIKRVVIGCPFPHPHLRGLLVHLLRQNDVEVDTWLMPKSSLAINRSFFAASILGRSYVTASFILDPVCHWKNMSSDPSLWYPRQACHKYFLRQNDQNIILYDEPCWELFVSGRWLQLQANLPRIGVLGWRDEFSDRMKEAPGPNPWFFFVPEEKARHMTDPPMCKIIPIRHSDSETFEICLLKHLVELGYFSVMVENSMGLANRLIESGNCDRLLLLTSSQVKTGKFVDDRSFPSHKIWDNRQLYWISQTAIGTTVFWEGHLNAAEWSYLSEGDDD